MFLYLWEVGRLCLLSGIYYDICIDLDGDFACNRVWWCHWAWYIPPIHSDPRLHRHFCRFCLDFQVKKHLLCLVVNRCFKSMHQPFQPWMKLYDCLTACNCWEKPLMSNSMHGYMHYHVCRNRIMSSPFVSFDFSKFASPGHFSLPLSPSSQLKAGLEFFVFRSPATECLDYQDCLATQNVHYQNGAPSEMCLIVQSRWDHFSSLLNTPIHGALNLWTFEPSLEIQRMWTSLRPCFFSLISMNTLNWSDLNWFERFCRFVFLCFGSRCLVDKVAHQHKVSWPTDVQSSEAQIGMISCLTLSTFLHRIWGPSRNLQPEDCMVLVEMNETKLWKCGWKFLEKKELNTEIVWSKKRTLWTHPGTHPGSKRPKTSQKRHTKHTMDKRQKTSKCPDILRILRDIPHLCTVKHL